MTTLTIGEKSNSMNFQTNLNLGLVTTPEMRMATAKSEKLRARHERVQKQIALYCQDVTLQFKDNISRKEWEKILELNAMNRYGTRIMEFAETWAKYMQVLTEKYHVSVAKVAKQTYYSANLGYLNEFLFDSAVDEAVELLSKYWIYGDELTKCFHTLPIKVRNVMVNQGRVPINHNYPKDLIKLGLN